MDAEISPGSRSRARMAALRESHTDSPKCVSFSMKSWWQLIRSISRTSPRPFAELTDDPVLHFLVVEQPEMLGPPQLQDVGIEFLDADHWTGRQGQGREARAGFSWQPAGLP